MTLYEFEQEYAERSGLTIDELHSLGLHGEPCYCGVNNCQGWQMVHDMQDSFTLFIPNGQVWKSGRIQ